MWLALGMAAFRVHSRATLRHPILAWHPLGPRRCVGPATNRSRWVGYLGRDRQRIPVWIAWQRGTAAPESALELRGHDILASKLFAVDAAVPRCAISGGHMAQAGERTLPVDGLWHRQHSLYYFWLIDLFPFRTNRHDDQPILTANATRFHRHDQCCEPDDVGASKSQQEQSNRPERSPLTYGLIIVGLALASALPLVMLAVESGGSETNHALHYDAAELSPVIGEWVEGEQGFQFTGNNLPIGVARAPLKSPGTILPRYLITDSWMASPGNVSFYWINTETSRVHSVPLTVSGPSVIDMSDYADFGNKP